MKALRKAIDQLLRLLDDQECRTRGRLPPLAQCARLAGVSKGTMSRAVEVLTREGRLTPVTGRGLLIGSVTPLSSSADRSLFDARRTPARDRIKSLLLDDITSGVFPPGKPLPACKHLCQRYRTGPQSLHKALVSLARDVNLLPHKRGYAIPAMKARDQGTIVLLHHRYGGIFSGSTFPSLRLEAFARSLEKRGGEMNFSFCAVPYARPNQTGDAGVPFETARAELDAIENGSTVLGYVLWSMTDYDRNHDLIAWLRGTGKPLVIVDDVGDYLREFPEALFNSVKYQSVGGSDRAPRRVAQHLVRLGHRRAAFLTLYHEMPWSGKRYAAVQDVFSASGGDCYLVASDPGPAGSLPASIAVDRYFELSKIAYILNVNSALMPGEFAGLAGRFQDAARFAQEELSSPILSTAFGRALADRTITAWICANDQLALLALGYLKERQIEVPGEISVIGFDDNLESLTAGLTTYNFNIEAVANRALDHILRSPRTATRRTQTSEETEGIIIERASAGPPPRKR